jgi:REP element-mobilizing transposase RayT
VFAVDVGTYSVLDNHFHLICRTRPDVVTTWSDEEVAWRWRSAWPRWENGRWHREPTDEAIEILLGDPDKIADLRDNLSSLSWFLARIKEPISRLANAESQCNGCFWESRFGSRELETEDEVLCCTLYVDLNQVKAGLAATLEESDHSAIQRRLLAEQQRAEWVVSQAKQSHHKFHQGARAKDFEFTVEQAAGLFSDCCLAPITDQGPLSTTEKFEGSHSLDDPPPDSSSCDTEATSTCETDEVDGSDVSTGGATVGASAERAAERRRGSRGAKSPSRRRHDRLVRQRRRRASNRTILSVPLPQYLALARRLASDIVRDWNIEPAHDDLRDASPANWRDAVCLFNDWARNVLASSLDASGELPDALRQVLGFPARGDPPAATLTS